jgi:DNA-binding transcriptional MerR regulator
MKFSISQISRLTGLSPSGIRFYERTGVISPLRGQNGKYRDYSMQELQLLLNCKQYRDCGFSMNESLELLNNSAVKDVKEQLTVQCEKLEQLVTEKQLLLELLKRKTREIDCLYHEQPCIELVNLPAVYRFKLWQPGAQEGSFTPYDEVLSWLELAPLTVSSLLIPQESFLHGSGDLQADWGLAIEASYVERLKRPTGAFGVYHPQAECVHTFVKINVDMSIPAAELKPARKFLRDHNLQICGPIITSLFYLTNFKEVLTRIDQLRIPVIKCN